LFQKIVVQFSVVIFQQQVASLQNMTEDIMYKALLERDASFEGLFFAGIKTTGIFCRPTCRARKPKRENVSFYKTSVEAMASGFRPCKICSPLHAGDAVPKEIQELITNTLEDPTKRITDEELRERGLEPASLRRWFKKHYGMTFQSYQRMSRLNTAFTKLREGESVTSTAFETGFESLSGFNDSFKAHYKTSPSRNNEVEQINYITFETPLGQMVACSTEKGICLLEFTDRRMLPTEFNDIKRKKKAVFTPGLTPHHKLLQEELTAYFSGMPQTFTVPLDVLGTPFQQEVWRILQQIPYGETRSYKQQAVTLGNPSAVRAVARANGMNKIAIIIPCHRVIGEDGKLTGYGGGLWRKQWLLEKEKQHQTLS